MAAPAYTKWPKLPRYRGRGNTTPLETTEEQRFVRLAKALGCKCRKLNGTGNRDWPDQLVLVPGGVKLLFEFKRVGKELRPTQEVWHDAARKIGHAPYTVITALQAILIVKGCIK